MTTFAYSAINASGLEFDGTLSAADLAAAIDQLYQRGLRAERLEQIEDADPATTSTVSASAFKGVRPKSLQVFSRQFATMIEAGMNVVSSLVILEQQTTDGVLSNVIAQLREDVEAWPAALRGDGAPPEGLQPPLCRDGRGRGGGRHPRHRARPCRAPDREGRADQAAREGRDDLPDDRLDLRHARPDRDAALPGPDLREDLRLS